MDFSPGSPSSSHCPTPDGLGVHLACLSTDTHFNTYVVLHAKSFSPFLATNLPGTPPKDSHGALHMAEPPDSMPRTVEGTGCAACQHGSMSSVCKAVLAPAPLPIACLHPHSTLQAAVVPAWPPSLPQAQPKRRRQNQPGKPLSSDETLEPGSAFQTGRLTSGAHC